MKAIYFSLSAKKNENINEYFETATKIFLIKFNFYEQDNQVVVLNFLKFIHFKIIQNVKNGFGN